MASPIGEQTSSVEKSLIENPQEFSFFQAIRLLRLAEGACDKNGCEGFYRNDLRIRPHLSLGFPATDLVGVEVELKEDGSKLYRLTASFLGLYGSSSPLPTFYTEELLDEKSDDRSVSRDFIDILNNHFYIEFYKSWSRYRLMLKVVEEQDSSWLDRILCLIGLGHEEIRSNVGEPYRRLRHAGLLTQFPRSAVGLETLCKDMFDTDDVEVVPCVKRYVSIREDQRLQLGQTNNQLGEDAILGQQIADQIGKCAILVRQLKAEAFRESLPGSERHDYIMRTIKYYLVQPLEFDLVMGVDREEIETTQPGNTNWARLGQDTWIFSGEAPENPEVTLGHNGHHELCCTLGYSA